MTLAAERSEGTRIKEALMGRDRRQRRRRAAVLGGAAIAAKKHHDAKEAEAAASPESAPEPAGEAQPTGGLTSDQMEQLRQLGELHAQDLLTDDEFAREKAKLLGTD